MALPLAAIAGIVAGVGTLASLASSLTKKPPALKYKYQSGTPDPMLSYLPDYRVEPMRKAYEYVEPKNIASKILGVAGTVLGATGTAMGGFSGKKEPTGETTGEPAATRGAGVGAGVTEALGTGTARTLAQEAMGVGLTGWKLPEFPVTTPTTTPVTTFGMPSEGPIKPESMLVAQPTTVPRPTKAPFSNTPELPKLPEFKGWNTDIFKRIPALTTLWGSEKVPDWMNFQEKIYKQYPKQYL